MKLILCGGGYGEQTKLSNKKLNEIIDHNKPLLYVPLAMDEDEHPYSGCLEWIKGELKDVNIPYIDMVRDFEELANKDYDNYCAIFLGGGNTYKLLLGLKQSGSFEKIKKYVLKDGIVFGSSAGAVIFGYDIDIISSMDPNEVKLKDTKGFNMLSGISIFPHYINKKSKLTEEENENRINNFTNSIIKFSKEKGMVIAIPEENSIYINGNEIEIIGTREYYTFEDGIIKENKISNQKLYKLTIK